ncbi:hypothetical protein KJA13_02100 [Patescibacteria group bacterium]|nr:hypothetical protein [Patescibacteria group bacterium]
MTALIWIIVILLALPWFACVVYSQFFWFFLWLTLAFLFAKFFIWIFRIKNEAVAELFGGIGLIIAMIMVSYPWKWMNDLLSFNF